MLGCFRILSNFFWPNMSKFVNCFTRQLSLWTPLASYHSNEVTRTHQVPIPSWPSGDFRSNSRHLGLRCWKARDIETRIGERKHRKSRLTGNTRPWELQIPDLQRIFELVGSLIDLSSVSCHATQSVEKEMELSFIHIKLTSGSSRYSWGGPSRCLCTIVQTYHVDRATH